VTIGDVAALQGAIASVASMLSADGYEMRVVRADSEALVLHVQAGPEACAECLVPAAVLELYVRDALADAPQWSDVHIELRYPMAHDEDG
jgi:hypothetical protein